MKILFDTNIILDTVLDRKAFSTAATHLMAKVEQGEIIGLLCATTITTIYYLAHKELKQTATQTIIQNLLTIFEIAPVNRTVLSSALKQGFSDFEDAVLHEAALAVKADAIITRDPRGFKQATLPIYSPQDFFTMLEALKYTSH